MTHRRQFWKWRLRCKGGKLLAFQRDDSGAVAVEFAVVAVPFFFLLFAILEISLIAFDQQSFDYAVQEGARAVFTGQAKNSNLSEAKFKEQICKRAATGLMNCNNTLKLDIKAYGDLAEMGKKPSGVVVNGVIDTSGFGYNLGSPGDVVIIRAVVKHMLFNPFAPTTLIKLSNENAFAMMSTAAFRNEP
ncbi:MAG: TadE/TadG family type IV pilus assembly protein [Beijerinckiaceae bacterium]